MIWADGCSRWLVTIYLNVKGQKEEKKEKIHIYCLGTYPLSTDRQAER